MNPAPADRTFLGYTAFTYGRIMMVVASVPLLVFLIGYMADAARRHQHGVVIGAGICLIGFSLILLAGAGIASWVLYACGFAIVCIGLLTLGAVGWYKGTVPRSRWMLPLAIGLLVPLLALARTPSSPLLQLGDPIAYLLLESVGITFGVGWVAFGAMFASVPLVGEQSNAQDAREPVEN
jgi:hypothetical protein